MRRQMDAEQEVKKAQLDAMFSGGGQSAAAKSSGGIGLSSLPSIGA